MHPLVLSILILIALIMLILMIRIIFTTDEPTLNLTYESNLSILSGPERAFINTIEPILSTNYKIFPKVRLADIIEIRHKTGLDSQDETMNKINTTTVSFLLCYAADLKIAGIIDIEEKDRIGDDKDISYDFIETAAAEAGIPFARVISKLHYDTDYIATTFANYVVTPEQKTEDNENKYGNCPSCNEPLMLLKAKHGDNIGKYFLGCTNYPECKYLSPIDESQNNLDI